MTELEFACHLLDAPTWEEALVRLAVFADWCEEQGLPRYHCLEAIALPGSEVCPLTRDGPLASLVSRMGCERMVYSLEH